MTEATPVVFVVDDDPSIVRSISRFLKRYGFSVEAYASPQEFLAKANPQTAGCVLLDVMMPQMSGLEVQSALLQRGYSWPIIFLTGVEEVAVCKRAIQAGALDYLVKPFRGEELRAVVEKALAWDAQWRKDHAGDAIIRERLKTLTRREREVLRHVLAGKRSKVIAYELGIVEKTIKVHRSRIMQKFGASSIVDLVEMARRSGFVDEQEAAAQGRGAGSLARPAAAPSTKVD